MYGTPQRLRSTPFYENPKEKDIAEKLEGKPSVANSLAMLTNSSWGRLYKSQAVNDYIAMTDNFYAKEKRKAEEKAKR